MSLIASCIVAYWITEISLGMKSFTEETSTLKEPKIRPSATPILLSITAGNLSADIKVVTPLSCYAGKPLRRYGTRL